MPAYQLHIIRHMAQTYETIEQVLRRTEGCIDAVYIHLYSPYNMVAQVHISAK